MVKPEEVSDDEMVLLARKCLKRLKTKWIIRDRLSLTLYERPETVDYAK
jgi:hypothetical protein